MDVSNSITLALSIVALIVSAFLAVRQNSLQRLTNNAPALVDLLSQFRSSAIHEGFDFVCGELGSYDESKGLTGLPPEVRYKVYDVCYFLQQFACMMIFDLVEERAFTALLRARTVAVWAAVGPFIRAERVINPSTGPEFMTALEAFAAKAASLSPAEGRKILDEWMARGIPPFPRWPVRIGRKNGWASVDRSGAAPDALPSATEPPAPAGR
ncbi:hypothetical protein [Rugosimonospora africana]|uniref:DUF4760 domain-containing protein n=1 Tax=Rugosimonospora africana TaxID=556532 RepID=A0A8J3QMK7_9ACTN|nr:hypothetical protein [Rugosimonospora africana]GIH13830.1 hypothetical protein Raf01_20020 [Rugosimonospora africana]